MPLYLNTRGKTTLAIAICGRCGFKMAHADMVEDPNTPGIRGHAKCMDQFDPWRLPAPGPDKITIQYPRPDVSLVFEDDSIITFVSNNGELQFINNNSEPLYFRDDS